MASSFGIIPQLGMGDVIEGSGERFVRRTRDAKWSRTSDETTFYECKPRSITISHVLQQPTSNNFSFTGPDGDDLDDVPNRNRISTLLVGC